jgi:hypothetical protein
MAITTIATIIMIATPAMMAVTTGMEAGGMAEVMMEAVTTAIVMAGFVMEEVAPEVVTVSGIGPSRRNSTRARTGGPQESGWTIGTKERAPKDAD